MVLSKVLVIDGGFATQLTVHVGKSVDGDPLWSARCDRQHILEFSFNYTEL